MTREPRVLTDEQLARYHQDGFLVAEPPMLDLDEVAAIREHTDRLASDWDNIPSRRANGKNRVPDEDRNISEILGAAVIDPDLGRLPVVDHLRRIAGQVLGVDRVWFHFDHLFYKQPGDESRVPWHQDRASSPTGMAQKAVHFWVPLQDVTEDSGCMLYIPGSHRHGLQDHVVQNRSDGVVIRSTPVDEDRAVPCPVAMGGVVLHGPMTLHGSGPNHSDDIRRAWVLQFGVGPWVALRQAVRPIQSRYARFQIAGAKKKAHQPA